MNLVSHCCGKSIVQGTRKEHPLNDRYSISYKTDVCEGCGQECDPIEVCDECGEPFEGQVRETKLGDLCVECFEREFEKLANQIKKDWEMVV